MQSHTFGGYLQTLSPLEAAYARMERVTRTLDALAEWEASRLAPDLFPAQTERPTGLSRETLLSLRRAIADVIAEREAQAAETLQERRN